MRVDEMMVCPHRLDETAPYIPAKPEDVADTQGDPTKLYADLGESRPIMAAATSG